MNKLRTGNILLFCLTVLGLSVVALPGAALAKSVYLAAEHHQSLFDAWMINPNGTVTYQATYNLEHATDPAGIAIDEDSGTIFITSEFSGGVEMVDPITLTYVGVSSGPSNLAGIDVDDVNDIVYAVKRGSDDLFIFDWDPVGKVITQLAQIDLPNCNGAYGISLDEFADVLWVADTVAGVVRAYDVDVAAWNDIAEIPGMSFTPSHNPVDVAVDRMRSVVYTVSMSYGATVPPGTGSNLLSKYDLATTTETTVDLGHQGVGLAVDEVWGFVYVTGGSGADNLEVWDTSASPFAKLQDTGRIGNPAGLAIANISYGSLMLAKNDDIVGEVYIGSTFTYEITYENQKSYDVTNVTLLDTLPPELDFMSATHGGVYDPITHTVLWDIGTLAAGESGPTIELVVKVNQNAIPGSTIYNYATIDADEVPPKTVVDDERSDDPNDEIGTPIGVAQVIDIDICPNRVPNRVYLSGDYVIHVAVLGSEEFDVTTLDPSTVLFGPTGTEAGPAMGPIFRDIIQPTDGFVDALYGFRTFDCDFELGDTEGLLTGLTTGGTPIEGSDSVLVLSGNKPPIAEAGGPYEGVVGQPIVLNAQGSYDQDGEIMWYCWVWGPGGKGGGAIGPTCEHTWYSPYSGPVYLIVIDDENLYGMDIARVEIRSNGL